MLALDKGHLLMSVETGIRPNAVSWLMDGFKLGLAQVLDDANEGVANVEWHPRTGIQALAEMAGGNSGETHWWEQPLSNPPGAVVWVGASKEIASAFGLRMRKSAGSLGNGSEEDLGGYSQFLRQALLSLANTLTKKLGTSVQLHEGRFLTETPESDEVFSMETTCGALTGSLLFGLNQVLLERVRRVPSSGMDATIEEKLNGFQSLGALSSVQVSVSVLIGRTQLTL
jgi:hypothetical protein